MNTLRMTKVRDVLRRTLEEQLAASGAEMAGPWRMLSSESGAWDSGARLNPAIFAAMNGQFGDNIMREVLLAAAGVKVSRTCLGDSQLELLQSIASEHAFSVVASDDRYIHRPDVGKGGTSNRIERQSKPDQTGGLWNVYIAAHPSLAATARMLEEMGDNEIFGLLLGIPQCCRNAFGRNRVVAAAKQNDFIGMALDATAGPMPFDPWLNYAANYFGAALISFFPCSFRCAAAAYASRNTYRMLRECNPSWAARFLDLHRTNILYTEYEGLHLFRQPLHDGVIRYGPGDFDSTEQTELSALLRRGDRLIVHGKRHVAICRGDAHIGTREGQDVGAFIFL